MNSTMPWRPVALVFAVAAVVAVLAAAPSPAAAQAATGSFERTLTVSGPLDLDVRTGSGSIEVRAGDGSTVRVIGKIRVSDSWRGDSQSAQAKVKTLESNPPIEQDGNRIRIGYVEDSELMRNVSISYDLTVPRETRLRSRTGSGSQRIGDIAGPLEIESGSGSLRIGSIGGEVRAEAGSGSIEITAVRGGLRAESGSGSIRARDVGGRVDVSAGSGSIEIAQSAPGEVSAKTGSGSITLTGIEGGLEAEAASGGVSVQGTATGDWRVSAASGGITLELPESAAFTLDAHTSSGSIESDHPITLKGTVGRHELRGEVRGGGPRISVSTSSGPIRIR